MKIKHIYTGKQFHIFLFSFVMCLFIFSSCTIGQKQNSEGEKINNVEKISGNIMIDGSSTVYPITEAVAEEFQKKYPEIKTTIGISGTGGGFKKFCRGEIDINDASRPIKSEEEKACAEGGIQYIELPVAYDGLAVVIHPKNTWVNYLTVNELKKMWEPDAQGKIVKWNQIRSEWPDEEIHLFGPGVDSGTFDYFTEAIVGKSKASRGDYTASEDDNVLVQGISMDKLALGFFGFAYYEENQDILKIVPITDKDDGGKAVIPSIKTVMDGSYQPLSRPLFIYVNSQSAKKKEGQKFVEFYIQNAGQLSKEVGYVPLSEKTYSFVLQRFRNGTLGSIFSQGASQVSVKLEELLSQ